MVKKISPSKSEAALPSVHEQLGLHPGQSVDLLKALHILTREGKLNQDSRRKLKQVNHLLQFIEPLLQRVLDDTGHVTLADHGAGKSYLGFMLYDRFFQPRILAQGTGKAMGHVYGIETRTELVERSRGLARELGFAHMSFLPLSVQAATTSTELPPRIDVVTALHACDTATDDAIAFGLAKQARHLVLVPCCQAEVAAALTQGTEPRAHPFERDVAAPAARARVWQPDHQRAALPAPGGARLPSHRDRAGGLGAFHEERADPGQPRCHRPAGRPRPRTAGAGAARVGAA